MNRRISIGMVMENLNIERSYMITQLRNAFTGIAVCLGFLMFAPLIQAQTEAYRHDQILVKPRAPITELHEQNRTQVIQSFPRIGGLQVVRLPGDLSVEEAIRRYEASGRVWYAVPDRTDYELAQVHPNDPKYTDGTLWGLHNIGQNGGLFDADIDAPEGWQIRSRAPAIIVAVTDTGVRYTHEDLAANMWVHPINGAHGTNSIAGTTDPMDDAGFYGGHGTHVAGTIAAVGDNGLGVTGVAWEAQIMAVKVFTGDGWTSTSALVAGIDYAVENRAHIINASWGGPSFDPPIRDAILAARNQGILFVASAGNNNRDIDSLPNYPAAYDLDNIVAVSASTKRDTRAFYSAWGLVKAHLAAPGGEWGSDGIYSTWRTSDSAYAYNFGTSMAAPHVSGALALLWAHRHVESYVQLKNRLLSSTDPLTSFAGLSQTGGRLNLNGALTTTFWRPRNDNFANAFRIARPDTVSAITFVANNVDATKQSGEPNHAGNAGGKSVWWNWQAPSSGSVTLRTLGSGFDTLLAVYTGSSVSSLTQVAANDDGGQGGTSQLTFNAVSGTTYRIAVDGKNGAHGTIKLTMQTSSAAQPASLRFTLNSLQRPSGQFKATITGPASKTVYLDTSSDLVVWTPRTSFTLSGSGSYNYTDTTATAPVRFYRASIATSPAQQSVNVVGYVDRTMPAGLSMHCNPFNASNNHISTVLPDVPDWTSMFRWDETTQQYIIATFTQWDGGWDQDWILPPGEGFILDVQAPITRSFVGEVAQGHGVNPVGNGWAIRSSIVPQPGRVTTDLHLPVINGDVVSRMINGSYVNYTYTGNGTWSPSEPSVSVGEAFWSNKNVGFWWHRNFLVWP